MSRTDCLTKAKGNFVAAINGVITECVIRERRGSKTRFSERKEDVGSRYFQHRYQCSSDGTAMQDIDTLSSSIDKSAALVPLAKRVAAALRRSWRRAQAGILTDDVLNALGNGVKELRS